MLSLKVRGEHLGEGGPVLDAAAAAGHTQPSGWLKRAVATPVGASSTSIASAAATPERVECGQVHVRRRRLRLSIVDTTAK